MPVLEVGGHAIGHRVEGPESAPLVLFSHCSLGHAGLWKGVMAELCDAWRCVAVDLPGHGASDRGDESIWLQDQAVADNAALAAHYGDGRAHLVGLSIGGAIMTRTAVRRPGVARSLALIEPILMQLIVDARPEMSDGNHAVMKDCYAACAEGRYRDGARAFMEGWGQPGQFDRFPEAAKESVGRAMRWIYEDFPIAHGWVEGQITREEIAAIAVPTLLMQGELTQPSAKAVNEEVMKLLPRSGFAEIAGGGHLSPVEKPKEVAAVLRRFLEEAEAGAAVSG